jgi:hypothetical protein
MFSGIGDVVRGHMIILNSRGNSNLSSNEKTGYASCTSYAGKKSVTRGTQDPKKLTSELEHRPHSANLPR